MAPVGSSPEVGNPFEVKVLLACVYVGSWLLMATDRVLEKSTIERKKKINPDAD